MRFHIFRGSSYPGQRRAKQPLSLADLDKTHAVNCTIIPRRIRLLYSLTLLPSRLETMWRIWRGAIRSCYGHIRSQSSKATDIGVSFGPAPFWDQSSQTYQAVPESLARSLYTKILSATHPWADTADLRIFLMGFESGEQWALHMGNGNRTHVQTPAWLNLAEKVFGFIPDKVRQEIIAFNGLPLKLFLRPSPESRASFSGSCYLCFRVVAGASLSPSAICISLVSSSES